MLALQLVAADGETPRKIKISVDSFYNPNTPTEARTRRLIELMQEDPDLEIERWGGIQVPGGAGRASLMMSIAGGTAPDVGLSWFHIIRNDMKQGFLYPLNEWIGDDVDAFGSIPAEKLRWKPWMEIPALWRLTPTSDGKIYGIPVADSFYMGIVFRMDMVRAAGLDPDAPPKTWDEFEYWCLRLSNPGRAIAGRSWKEGQKGYSILPWGYTWLPWMESAGGTPIVQVRKSPTTGKEYQFPPDATVFRTPDGEDLSRVEPRWKADFASEAGIRAAGFYHRLSWMKWTVDPDNGEPVVLGSEEIGRGEVRIGDKLLRFKPEDVVTGVARSAFGQRGTGVLDQLARGEIAMTTMTVGDLQGGGISATNAISAGIDPEILSWFPFPAAGKDGEKTRRVVQKQNHYMVMFEGVGRRSKEERDKAWKVISTLASPSVRDYAIRSRAISGMARFADPVDLKRLGLDDYLQDVPEAILENYRQIENGGIRVSTEPWIGYWVTMDGEIARQVLSLILSEKGESFDYKSALKMVEEKANSGVMFETPKEVLDSYRPAARVIFAVVVAGIVIFTFLIVRQQMMAPSKCTVSNVYRPWMPWLLAGPALILIALWSYYPLLRGMVMAFQDYKVAGTSKFVGLDNFIILAVDMSFWKSLLRTAYFVVLNMVFAFLTPIFLAFLLSEVPKFKVFFRTVFFLPQVSSGLVIALLWKIMYDPTPAGFLNKLIVLLNHLPFIHIDTQTWLQDPQLAMICCIIPTVWATMGMASLIYLAALHSIPDDLYEAADIDGAGILMKIRHIVVPTLLPLIIINFVGAFIGTFQNMGNIFLLTFGGPGDATMVLSLRIWVEAYNNLRFSMATSMAWVLGSLLIGFTYMQIRLLRRVEFRKAEWS